MKKSDNANLVVFRCPPPLRALLEEAIAHENVTISEFLRDATAERCGEYLKRKVKAAAKAPLNDTTEG